MQHILAFILTILTSLSYGQNFTYPTIKQQAKEINDFVPVGWMVLDSADGDLNKDGVADVAIILQHKDSILLTNSFNDTVLTQPRILLVLFRNAVGNTFTVAEQSNTFILKHDNPAMDDPYLEMAINKGVLEIKFHLFYNSGSWYVTNAVYKFRYQQENFVLIGADNASFHRATHDFEEYSYNFLTKKRAFTKGNDNKRIKNTTWKTVDVAPLKTLKTFGEPFTWEVEKSIFL